MADKADKLRWTLQGLGLSEPAINAAWPVWWSDDAEASGSAMAELRFSLARKLGLDPRSLLEGGEPRFVWRDEAKFKRLSTENDAERAAICSFGISIARALLAVTSPGPSGIGMGAKKLRESILANQPFVRLVDLLGLCWALGIPVIYLRVFPLAAKRMCAMAVQIGERFAILLAKDADYPAPIAYFVAHEFGHGALGHLKDGTAVVDLQDPLESLADIDDEERDADRFALELLTGMPEPFVLTETRRFTAGQLAQNLVETARALRIEPGTLALCFGHSTKEWAKANAAMNAIYTTRQPVWKQINEVARKQIAWSTMPDDLASFIGAVMGGLGGQ